MRDWNLLSKEPQENIFKGELFEGGWCQTSDILNVKVEMMSFLDDVGRPKEPKYHKRINTRITIFHSIYFGFKR